MYHHMVFDPYLIGERHQQLLREVQALRLEKRLCKDHKVRGSQLIGFAFRLKNALHLFRKVGLAER